MPFLHLAKQARQRHDEPRTHSRLRHLNASPSCQSAPLRALQEPRGSASVNREEILPGSAFPAPSEARQEESEWEWEAEQPPST
ncbi:hypothetical protein KUCAC02_034964 [Chaenocephalus aceratus]|nr:hypothetical protein KUCAC02_034964 [Chaenocephalus aceratus]